jgi:hypothetical protein
MSDAVISVATTRTRVSGVLFGAVDLLAAFLGYLAIFEGLPTRYLPIDLAAGCVIALLALAGVGLAVGRSWALVLARVASVITLAAGLALITGLVLGASYLSGIYGPVGRGGAIIEVLSAALALPYLVVLPAAQLVWASGFTTRS